MLHKPLTLLPFLAVAIVVLVWTAGTASPQHSPRDYPQWRGQNREGVASAFSEPKAWPEKLTRRWRVDAGEGYGTPLVVGDAVYIFTRRDGNEVMMAFDAETDLRLDQVGGRDHRPRKPTPRRDHVEVAKY
jgi:hypothetical protein